MEEIVHPSFFIADIEADIYTQNKEHRLSPSTVMDTSLLEKTGLMGFAPGRDVRIEIPQVMHQFYF
jgi:hypothetical protein